MENTFFGLLINFSKSDSLLISSYFTILATSSLDEELLGLKSALSILSGEGEFWGSSKIYSYSTLAPKSISKGLIGYYSGCYMGNFLLPFIIIFIIIFLPLFLALF